MDEIKNGEKIKGKPLGTSTSPHRGDAWGISDGEPKASNTTKKIEEGKLTALSYIY